MLDLKELRKKAGLSSKETAKRSGISYPHYNFIENRKRRPSVEVAKRIATVLGFEWTRFFENEQESA